MSRLVRAASAISGLTLLSRVFGLWRDSLMAAVLGAGAVSDTFFLAWALPNLMRRLLGEGALSASFVPAYTAARKRGEEQGNELLQRVLGAVLLILLPVTALVVIGSIVANAVSGDADGRGGLLLELNAILFPYTIPICVTAMLSGALNTRGSFALPAAVPIVLNVIWIATLYVAEPLGITGDASTAKFLSWSLCVGGFAQLALVVVPLLKMRALRKPTIAWPAASTPARAVFSAMAPTVLGMSLGQISTLIDQSMAYSLLGEGANTYLYLANRLLLFPHALTALAVVVAVFPKLASDATEVDRATMRTTLDRAAAAMLFVTVPAAAGLFALADDVVAGLFVRRNFTDEDAAATATTTRMLLAGLPFLGLSQLYARAYYSLGLTKEPARIAAWLLLANVALNALLIGAFGMGTEGLAASTSACAIANAALLAIGLRRHVPRADVRRGLWLRNLVATVAMCGAIWLVRADEASSRTAILLWRVAAPIGVGMVVYFAVHLLMRSEELQTLRRRKRS